MLKVIFHRLNGSPHWIILMQDTYLLNDSDAAPNMATS